MCKVSQFFYEQIKNSAFCFVALSCKILYNIVWLYETFIVLQKFYIKNKNDFYVLTVANEPQQFSKVIDDALKENLEKILFDNGKFE